MKKSGQAKTPSVKKVAEVVQAQIDADASAAGTRGSAPLFTTAQTPESLINNTVEKMTGSKRNAADNPTAARLLEQLDPSIIAINHINGILGIASRHSTKLGAHAVGVQHYRKVLVRLAGIRKLDDKKYEAARHLKPWEKIFVTFKAQIMDGSFDWLAGGEVITIPFQKTKAVIPLTAIYELLNAPGAPEHVVKDATNLEHHLWSIFACVTNNEEDRANFRKNAAECKVEDDADKMTKVSLLIRDRVVPQLTGDQVNINDAPNIAKNLINNIAQDPELKEALDGVKSVFENGGTIDMQAIQAFSAAINGAASLPQVDDEPEDDEAVSRTSSAPVAAASSSSSSSSSGFVSSSSSKDVSK